MEVSFPVRLKTRPEKFRHRSPPSKRSGKRRYPRSDKLLTPRKRVRRLKMETWLEIFTLRTAPTIISQSKGLVFESAAKPLQGVAADSLAL
ncbi:hypothetical protein H0E87_029727, partial [Populus deltoides]